MLTEVSFSLGVWHYLVTKVGYILESWCCFVAEVGFIVEGWYCLAAEVGFSLEGYIVWFGHRGQLQPVEGQVHSHLVDEVCCAGWPLT